MKSGRMIASAAAALASILLVVGVGMIVFCFFSANLSDPMPAVGSWVQTQHATDHKWSYEVGNLVWTVLPVALILGGIFWFASSVVTSLILTIAAKPKGGFFLALVVSMAIFILMFGLSLVFYTGGASYFYRESIGLQGFLAWFLGPYNGTPFPREAIANWAWFNLTPGVVCSAIGLSSILRTVGELLKRVSEKLSQE